MPETPLSPPSPTERADGAPAVVELCGEIDILTVPPLEARLDALTAGPHPDVVLDLRPVAFIDCTGLGLLCRTRNRVMARGGRLRLVSDSGSFLKLLRRTGLAGAFELCSGLPGGLVTGPQTCLAAVAG